MIERRWRVTALALGILLPVSACASVLGVSDINFTDGGADASADTGRDVGSRDSRADAGVDGPSARDAEGRDTPVDTASHVDAEGRDTGSPDSGHDAGHPRDAGAPDASPIVLVQTLAPGSNTTVTQSVSLQESAGDALVAAIYTGCGATTVTVSDTLGNAWQSTQDAYNGNANVQVQLWYAINIKAGANTITFTPSSCGDGSLGAVVLEYSGVATSNALDGSARQVAPSASNTMSAGSITTTGALDQVIAVFADPDPNGGTPMTPAGAFDDLNDDGEFTAMTEDLPAGTGPGVVTPTATLPPGQVDHDWVAAAIALRSSGGTVTLVQSLSTGSGAFQSITNSASLTETTGDALVAGVYSQCGFATTTLTDSLGNTWHSTTAIQGNDASTAQLWYALDVKGGANTLTLNVSGCGSQWVGVLFLEYSGVASMNALDGTTGAGAPTDSNAMTAGTITTTGARDQVIALFVDPDDGGQMTAGTGFNVEASDTDWIAMVEDIPGGTSPGAVTISAALPAGNSDDYWAGAAIALRAQ